MRAFENQAGIVSGASGALEGASLRDGTALRAQRVLPRRALLALALLSLLLGATLYQTLLGGRSSATPVTAATHSGFAQLGLLSLPQAAAGPVSATLGADSASYRISGASAGGLRAATPAQHLNSSFTAAGVSVSSGATRVGLDLRGVGYGSALRPLAAVRPRAAGNRVLYARPGLSEWYTNGPLGLEQGFTLASAPAVRAAGPLTLSLALTGNARASLAAGGESVALSRAGRTVLRYTALSVSDASGRALRSWFALAGGRLLLRVDARRANYPLRIDPLVQQGEKLTVSGESGEGGAGFSVALSADGHTALIGAPFDDNDVGAAWVFTRTGSTWTQQGAIVANGEVGQGRFGASVALSADGNTAVLGAPSNRTCVGAAWAFTRSGSTWKKQAEFASEQTECPTPDSTKDWGTSVAISGDGNTAIVGGPPPGPFAEGGFWVFSRSGSSWSKQDEVDDVYGDSAALSFDGNTALLGGIAGDSHSGAAQVFTRSGAGWSPQGGELTNGSEEFGLFGGSVALSSDGNTALVGEGGSEVGDLGAAWVFRRQNGEWPQPGEKLTGGKESGNGEFGNGVALSGAGATALIGAPADNSSTGAAWVFVSGPGVTTETVVELATTAATVTATVNPNEETVSECKFEYGTTITYGKSTPCSVAPGSGGASVPVSATLTGLSTDTTYHYRISATSSDGTSTGGDETFTTLLTSASASTKNPAKPATATDGQLTAKASGGTGTVTVGPYGADVGGPPLPRGTGKYLDVYHSGTSSFAQLEIKDCELGGGKTLWWENPAGTWEAIAEPPAVFSEAPTPCITVIITESTKPSIAQLVGTRFGTRFGELPGPLEYGKCEATKDGFYAEGNCLEPDSKNKGGVTKGKFEFYRNPVECFAKKHGDYAEGKCLTLDIKNGAPKGKFERGVDSFEGSGGVARFEIETVGALECASSTSVGAASAQKSGIDVITYQGCKLGKSTCSSTGETAGAVRTFPLETFIEEEGEKVVTEVFQDPIMTFTCAGEEFTLQGGFRGEVVADVNKMSLTSESVFRPGVGGQELETKGRGKEFRTSMSASETATAAQPIEISTNP